MKKKLHPKYHQDTQVECTCGETFTTGSTLKSIKVEICSACHPFFTGEMKFVDSLGRVEKFKKRQQHAAKVKKTKTIKTKKAKKPRPTTLREMMMQQTKQSKKPKK